MYQPFSVTNYDIRGRDNLSDLTERGVHIAAAAPGVALSLSSRGRNAAVHARALGQKISGTFPYKDDYVPGIIS